MLVLTFTTRAGESKTDCHIVCHRKWDVLEPDINRFTGLLPSPTFFCSWRSWSCPQKRWGHRRTTPRPQVAAIWIGGGSVRTPEQEGRHFRRRVGRPWRPYERQDVVATRGCLDALPTPQAGWLLYPRESFPNHLEEMWISIPLCVPTVAPPERVVTGPRCIP